MNNAYAIVVIVVGMISASSFAQNNGYILVNNNLETTNSASAFKVTASGNMSFFKTIETGGVGLGGGYFATQGLSIESRTHCLFVTDSGSDDIAIFEGPTFKQILPSFTNPQLKGDLYGIGLAVDPAGKFLYTAWTTTDNLAVLAIGSDCSLSLVGNAIAQPDAVAGLTVTHNGKVLVVSYPNVGGAQAYSTSSTGKLTPLGPQLSFNNAIAECASVGCFPSGQDATDDGVYWVWGNGTLSEPSTLSATLTPKGFTSAALQTYSTTVKNVEVPWFSPGAAKSDSGNLYLGASGFGPGSPAGIIVTTFNKGTITYASEVVNNSALFAGVIQTIGTSGTGSPLVQIVEESAVILNSYAVNGTTLTQVGSLQDPVSTGSFAITAFPKRP